MWWPLIDKIYIDRSDPNYIHFPNFYHGEIEHTKYIYKKKLLLIHSL